MATLPDLSDLPVIAGIIAATVFATYAVISLTQRPYESPQYVTAVSYTHLTLPTICSV